MHGNGLHLVPKCIQVKIGNKADNLVFCTGGIGLKKGPYRFFFAQLPGKTGRNEHGRCGVGRVLPTEISPIQEFDAQRLKIVVIDPQPVALHLPTLVHKPDLAPAAAAIQAPPNVDGGARYRHDTGVIRQPIAQLIEGVCSLHFVPYRNTDNLFFVEAERRITQVLYLPKYDKRTADEQTGNGKLGNDKPVAEQAGFPHFNPPFQHLHGLETGHYPGRVAPCYKRYEQKGHQDQGQRGGMKQTG